MTARLYEKRGTWHIVLIYTNQQGKRAQKWINTGLAIKGNSRRAKQMMARAITEWGPVLEDTGRPATEAMQSLPLPRRNKVGFDSPSGILFADYLTTWQLLLTAVISKRLIALLAISANTICILSRLMRW